MARVRAVSALCRLGSARGRRGQEVVEGEGYALGNVERARRGPGFRKVRRALGVTAFGVDAIEIPAGYETGRHYHEEQEELYFVFRGQVEIEFGDGSSHLLGPARTRPRGCRDGSQAQERGR